MFWKAFENLWNLCHQTLAVHLVITCNRKFSKTSILVYLKNSTRKLNRHLVIQKVQFLIYWFFKHKDREGLWFQYSLQIRFFLMSWKHLRLNEASFQSNLLLRPKRRYSNTYQEIQKHNICWVDEGNVLKMKNIII